MFHVPEKFRELHRWAATSADGNNGVFRFPSIQSHRKLVVVASDGGKWEHVSVHAVGLNGEPRTPSWAEMCFTKDIFWDEEDVVIQYHPRKSDYVNTHPDTLHMWRPIDVELPTPPREFV